MIAECSIDALDGKESQFAYSLLLKNNSLAFMFS